MPSLAVFVGLDGTLIQYDRPYEAITAATLEAHLGTSSPALVASYDAGAHKPAPAPFRRAEAALPANEYLLIGDGNPDVEGARDAGWRAVRHPDADPFWARPRQVVRRDE